MSYDKCKKCLHQDATGQPVFDNKNCVTCIIQGNYLGYESVSKVENTDKYLKYDKPLTWLSLIVIHTCFIIACLVTSLHLLFTVNVVWIILAVLASVIIDTVFVYVLYLLLTSNKFKKR